MKKYFLAASMTVILSLSETLYIDYSSGNTGRGSDETID